MIGTGSELLTHLPEGYIDDEDFLFFPTNQDDPSTPTLEISPYDLLVLIDKSGAEKVQQLRPYAIDHAIRALIDFLA